MRLSLLLLPVALSACLTLPTWRNTSGNPISQWDELECKQQALRATAGQSGIYASWDAVQIENNCKALKGYFPVR